MHFSQLKVVKELIHFLTCRLRPWDVAHQPRPDGSILSCTNMTATSVPSATHRKCLKAAKATSENLLKVSTINYTDTSSSSQKV